MKMNSIKTIKGASLLGVALSLIGSPAWGFDLTLQAPSTLTIDSQSINTGDFNLTGATGFFAQTPTTIGTTTILDQGNAGDDVVINATIGGTVTHVLLSDLNNDFQALELIGFFDATSPNLSAANFNITVFRTPSGNAFTYYLPATTSQALIYQITNLQTNTNFFSDGPPVLSIMDSTISITSGGNLIESTSGGQPATVANMNPHGTGRAGVAVAPEPVSTLFGSAIALGFGGLLKREYSRKNKKHKKKANS